MTESLGLQIEESKIGLGKKNDRHGPSPTDRSRIGFSRLHCLRLPQNVKRFDKSKIKAGQCCTVAFDNTCMPGFRGHLILVEFSTELNES
jgi:hypothetical protein